MGKKPATPLVKIPDVLIEAVKSKRVIPFLGAGASKESRNSAGKMPPDADQLRDILAQKFYGKLIPNRDVMAIAEMAISSAGGTGLFTMQCGKLSTDTRRPKPMSCSVPSTGE